jgi:hypothetical protein
MTTIATPQTHEELYRATAGTPVLVEVPPARFLMIDGHGRPGDERFTGAVAALYPVAYTAKFALQKAGGPVMMVPPLEGLFTTDVPVEGFDTSALEELDWTLMLRLPDPIDDALVERARAKAAEKRALPAIGQVRVELFDEGECAQVLHVGPYSAEGPTVALLHAFIHAHRREPRGAHPEIYLGDPRRAQPEKLKTIIRQPVG